ncbi:hypothetical protein AB4Z38_17895 [Arthrobacter sp. 2RAF6]|uniref:hypothetical protein n=1 Tax=Arthrobacter sp. 2RAF6 TaxID=3233002 RepID=UPI003F8F4486
MSKVTHLTKEPNTPDTVRLIGETLAPRRPNAPGSSLIPDSEELTVNRMKPSIPRRGILIGGLAGLVSLSFARQVPAQAASTLPASSVPTVATAEPSHYHAIVGIL